MRRHLLALACVLLSLAPIQGIGHAATTVGQQTFAPMAYTNPPDLSDVTCPSTRVCYAVGFYGVQYNGTVIVTTDGAHTWHAQRPGTKWGLRGITCLSITLCYAVGFAETTVVTGDGGRTWRDPHRAQSPQALYRIACPSRLTCIATGNSPDQYTSLVHRLLLTTNGGRTWSYPATPIDRTTFGMNGIACPSTRVCYAVGAEATILVTGDAGRTWRQQQNPALNNGGGIVPPLQGVACVSVSACVAVGGFGSGGMILVTSNGGRTWREEASPARGSLSGVACPTTRICYAVGSSGSVVQSGNGGSTWSQIPTNTSSDLASIACPSTALCIVVGYGGYIGRLTGNARPTPNNVPTSTPARSPAQPTQTAVPTQPPSPSPTPTVASCASWNVSGTWQFQSMTMGNGQATLQQSGSTLSGTASIGGVDWTLQGNIQGANVTLSMTAQGQIPVSFQGTVSGDGTTINGNAGTFSGGHASCQ